MSGGQVIYLPDEKPGFGAGFGGSLAKASDRELERQQELLRNEATMKAIEAVKAAGSREKALQVITTPGVAQFKDATQLSQAMNFIDKLYPPKDETQHPIEAYDRNTGDPIKGYIKSGELGNLNNPGFVSQRFGENATLAKPQTHEFFKMDPVTNTFTSTGKKPIDKRGDGEMTKEEMDLFFKVKADTRGDQTATAQAKAAERGAAAAERSAAAGERSAEGLDLKRSQQYVSLVADRFNFKKTVGADGNVSIDFSGATPEMMKQWGDAIKRGPDLLKKHRDPMEAFNQLPEYKTAGDKAIDNPPPAKKEEKKTGPVQKAEDAIRPKGEVADDAVIKRFRSDPATKGATLGKKTPKGYEVYKDGKLIGHYS